MNRPEPPDDDILPGFTMVLLAIIIGLFAIRNLPWHLDEDEQAKQAFVSYQMIEEGKWLLQETPTGRVATKPPLQGWISAIAYIGMGANGWEFAWRLPAFAAALLILRGLWRGGEHLFGNNIGAVLAVSAFGLNFYVPRLATLVRTDMLLTALIFFTGYMIMEKLRTGREWRWQDGAVTCLLLLGSTLTKGPIAYGFLLPGIIAYLVITRKTDLDRRVWVGWLWWLLPLAVFGGWVAYGCANNTDFYKQVVEKEFLGRFTVGENARHNNFVPGFYTFFILIRTVPWTLLLIGAFATREVRAACKRDPVLLWLVCWTFGGLLFMECVPSKRFDRILPVLPPLCLLLAASVRYLPKFKLRTEPIGRIAILAPLLAVPLAGGYVGWKIFKGFRDDARSLVAFGDRALVAIGDHRDRLAVVNGKDEGILMYLHAQHFTRLEDALTMWRFKHIDWLVLPDGDFRQHRAALEPLEVVASTPPLPDKFNSYHLLRRVEPLPQASPGPASGQFVLPPIPAMPRELAPAPAGAASPAPVAPSTPKPAATPRIPPKEIE
jgi:hypothetical protein